MCVCVCVCARARARVCVCVCVCRAGQWENYNTYFAAEYFLCSSSEVEQQVNQRSRTISGNEYLAQ